MADTIHDRLKEARIRAGFPTAKAAAERFGWPADSYRSRENGHRGITRQWAMTYAKALSVPLDWLLTGATEDRTISSRTRQRSLSGNGSEGDLRRIPIIEWNRLPRSRSDADMGSLTSDSHIVVPSKISQFAIGLIVRDDSMVDPDGSPQSLLPGDYVLMAPGGRVSPGKHMLIWDTKSRSHMIRRAQVISTDMVRFVALNPDYAHVVELPMDSPHILAVRLGLMRLA